MTKYTTIDQQLNGITAPLAIIILDMIQRIYYDARTVSVAFMFFLLENLRKSLKGGMDNMKKATLTILFLLLLVSRAFATFDSFEDLVAAEGRKEVGVPA